MDDPLFQLWRCLVAEYPSPRPTCKTSFYISADLDADCCPVCGSGYIEMMEEGTLTFT